MKTDIRDKISEVLTTIGAWTLVITLPTFFILSVIAAVMAFIGNGDAFALLLTMATKAGGVSIVSVAFLILGWITERRGYESSSL